MKLRELYYKYDIKLVPLKDKTRLTKKSRGYGFFEMSGEIVHPNTWKRIESEITDYGVLCDYIPQIKLYYCVLDIDSKEFPVMQVLNEYPTAFTKTRHGYHLHYLSPVPCQIKQLTGMDKEKCPVDIRAKRDDDPSKEGNYIRLSSLIGDTTELLVVDFNDVITYTYSLFGIESRQRGEYDGNIKAAKLIKQNNNPKSNVELFLAYYLYYQKTDWKSAYDCSFEFGIKLAGWLNKPSMQRIGFKLMRISDYYGPKKWISSFLTGYEYGERRKPYFSNESLPPEMRVFLAKRFNELDEDEINELAKLLKNVKLYQILEVIHK